MIAATISVTLLIVPAILVAGVAMVLSYRRIIAALLAAYIALILAFAFGGVGVPTLLFWLAASAIAGAIVHLLPLPVSKSQAGVSFMTTGAIAGMMVGIALGTTAALVLGTAAGVIFGALIYGNTKGGRSIQFPSLPYFNYVLAKGLPLIVVMSTVGLTLSACILRLNTGM